MGARPITVHGGIGKLTTDGSVVFHACTPTSRNREPRAVSHDINVLALVKGNERYIFLYDDESRAEAPWLQWTVRGFYSVKNDPISA